MKKIQTIIATTLVGAAFVIGGLTVQAKEMVNDASLAKNANVSMEQAIAIAIKTVPGTAVKAEFDKEKGQSFWEVEVLADNQQVMELDIDANDGKVLKQQLDKVDHDHEESEYEEEYEDQRE